MTREGRWFHTRIAGYQRVIDAGYSGRGERVRKSKNLNVIQAHTGKELFESQG
jgi:hypothetical protein